MTEAFWTELGIAPTEDRGAIRKAYARRLKAIDPEADPQAFITLRDAHDAALNWLRWKQYDDEFGAEQGEIETPEPVDFPIDPEPAPPAYVSPWAAGSGDASSGEVDRSALDELDRLLLDADTAPDPVLLQSITRRILADPALERIDQADSVGAWLAGAIADASPRSDPIVAMVVEHFDWSAQPDSWNQNRDFGWVAQRHQVLSLIERISQPDHRWNKAYLSLTSSEDRFGPDDWRERSNVRDLLHFVGREAPAAVHEFNADRVDLWADGLFGPPVSSAEPKSDPVVLFPWWIWALAALMVAHAAVFMFVRLAAD